MVFEQCVDTGAAAKTFILQSKHWNFICGNTNTRFIEKTMLFLHETFAKLVLREETDIPELKDVQVSP